MSQIRLSNFFPHKLSNFFFHSIVCTLQSFFNSYFQNPSTEWFFFTSFLLWLEQPRKKIDYSALRFHRKKFNTVHFGFQLTFYLLKNPISVDWSNIFSKYRLLNIINDNNQKSRHNKIVSLLWNSKLCLNFIWLWNNIFFSNFETDFKVSSFDFISIEIWLQFLLFQ